MGERRLFDMGDAAVLHDRNAKHLQTGSHVRAMIETREDGWQYATGEIMGWTERAGERQAKVEFKLPMVTLTKTLPVGSLRLVSEDRWEMRKRAERLRDDGDTAAALLAEDLYNECTE